MRFTAVGDVLIQRRIPQNYEGFYELARCISRGDARYFNLETTLHYEGECYGSQFSGGTYLRCDPEVLEDCKGFGFNMVSFCNNHSLDFSYKGFESTLKHIKNSGLVQAGCGMNLAEAASPAYLDLPQGRIALIAAVSSCNPSCMAGEQSRRVPGRPGVNHLRFDQKIAVTPEQLEVIKRIAEETDYNAEKDISRKEGFLPELPEGCFDFGSIRFVVGEKPSYITSCNQTDLKRIKKAIFEAQLQADYILVAVHSHEISGDRKENPSLFLQEFAHFCIESGAHAVIGHGPHLLRPVELYKGKPIFYSLGDFFMENESVLFGPEDFFAKYQLNSDSTMHELMATRSNNFTRGLQTQRVMFETVVPYWEMEEGVLTRLEFTPVELNFDKQRSVKGRPRIAQDDAILIRLAEMSLPYGTKMEIVDNRAVVKL